MKSLKITQFTKLPGPRYRNEGPNSGEEFREDFLEPAFLDAKASGEQLTVDLDGVEFGYPTSFLEESFGGLARNQGIDPVLSALLLSANQEPLLVEEVLNYIRSAFQLTAKGTKR